MLYYTIGKNGLGKEGVPSTDNEGGFGFGKGADGTNSSGTFFTAGGGGGGASAIRIGSPLVLNFADIVCGGGGGAGSYTSGGDATPTGTGVIGASSSNATGAGIGGGGAGRLDSNNAVTNATGGGSYMNPDAFPDVTDKFPWAGQNTIAVGNGDCGRLILTDYGTTTAKGDGTYIINENTSNILNITRETVENLTEHNSTNLVTTSDILNYVFEGILLGLVLFAIFRPRGIKTVKVPINPPRESIH
jgi:hypothetical protein